MVSFIRWQPAPEITDYASPALHASCPVANEYEYTLPIRTSDQIKFISDAGQLGFDKTKQYYIGLMDSDCNNVIASHQVGTIAFFEEARQLFITVNIPAGLTKGACYRLVFFEYQLIATEWTQVAVSCQVNENGDQTGNQEIVEERQASYQNMPIAVSNPLRLSHDYEPTKLVEFKGERYDFGFDYTAFADFYQIFRLHVTVARPTYKESTGEYRQTNGVYRRRNTFIDKQRILETAYFDEPAHDAFENALHHKEFIVDGVAYFKSGEYELQHYETMIYNDRWHKCYPGQVELLEQGYNQQNNKCDLEPSAFKVFDDSFSDVFE